MLESALASTPTSTGLPDSASQPAKTDIDAVTLTAVLCGVGVLMALITIFSGVPAAFY